VQNYTAVGIQHILVPEPSRYLADRFVSVNIAVPPVEAVLRIAPRELLPALRAAFPMGVFELSFVPQAIRGFVHHFYPAYDIPMVELVRRWQSKGKPLTKGDKPPEPADRSAHELALQPTKNGAKIGMLGWGFPDPLRRGSDALQ
jgi:hypothetical protein